tara:strand:+ start:627 stop:875 length:249 start_codon:yes stop_codon:yes gene_type:complete
MKFILTMVICSVINGKTQCIPPYTMQMSYTDAYECLLDGYNESYNKIVELGRKDVNKYNIYIKFGCNEDHSNKTPTSYIVIK